MTEINIDLLHGSFCMSLAVSRSCMSFLHFPLSLFYTVGGGGGGEGGGGEFPPHILHLLPQKLAAVVEITIEKAILDCQINLKWSKRGLRYHLIYPHADPGPFSYKPLR